MSLQTKLLSNHCQYKCCKTDKKNKQTKLSNHGINYGKITLAVLFYGPGTGQTLGKGYGYGFKPKPNP